MNRSLTNIQSHASTAPYDDETLALLGLSLIRGVGPALVGQLLANFGKASSIFQAGMDPLLAVPGIGRELAQRIVRRDFESSVDRELRACMDQSVRLLARTATDYPRLLTEIHDPPSVLYLQGTLQPEDALAIGIVGTRHASRYGLGQAERLAASLSRAGLTIVSGLARGIDAAAHRAALGAGGRTVAVVAGGLSQMYPPEHQQLADEIAAHGVVMSEMSLNCKPRRGAFPRRNRLISGLSVGVVVIEAALRSGALITARHALEQGREVFAVPGPVHSHLSRGCHQLLRDGAKLVETAADVLDELGPLMGPLTNSQGDEIRHPGELQLNEQEQAILCAIDSEGTNIDQIVNRTRLPIQRILATLSVLEMRHLIQRLSGDRVARR